MPRIICDENDCRRQVRPARIATDRALTPDDREHERARRRPTLVRASMLTSLPRSQVDALGHGVARWLVMYVAELTHRYASHDRNMSAKFHGSVGRPTACRSVLRNRGRQRCDVADGLCVSRVTDGANFATGP
jgi:hypothetical protein